MNSSDLALTIIVCVIVLAVTITSVARTIVRRHQPSMPRPESPRFDAPTEVWLAYYEAMGCSNEALANTVPQPAVKEGAP